MLCDKKSLFSFNTPFEFNFSHQILKFDFFYLILKSCFCVFKKIISVFIYAWCI